MTTPLAADQLWRSVICIQQHDTDVETLLPRLPPQTQVGDKTNSELKKRTHVALKFFFFLIPKGIEDYPGPGCNSNKIAIESFCAL